MKKGKLSFKGDEQSAKKHKKKRKTTGGTEEEKDTPTEGWVSVESVEDIMGPIIILSNANDHPSVLTSSDKSSKTQFVTIDPSAGITNFDPTSVAQVFVAKRLPDSTKISFKSSFDKYLGSDKIGVVGCEREAMGPAEEWTAIFREDGIMLQSSFDKFLSCAENGLARADSETAGFKEVFTIQCQAVNKFKSKKRKQESKVDTETLEADTILKYQSRGAGRLVLSTDDVAELRQAKKSGNLNEALLDRRTKLKSDKFCK
ncbi:FRG1-like family-domain-containing protein [Phlyctochytrium arcticum]|nr:FRG1-like family-domain-containing protein [Phlyctochytrium arcticum]